MTAAACQSECVISPCGTGFLKTAKWKLAVDFLAHSHSMESRIQALEQISSQGQHQPTEFIPIRFISSNELTKSHKLLQAFDALVFSEMLGREVSIGKIVYGDDSATLRVKVIVLAAELRKHIEKITELLSSNLPPDLS